MFHVASQTKTITAIAMMQLVEQGKLSLDDAASTYIPEMLENPDEHMHRITLRELLSHKAFISRDMEQNYWSLQDPFPDTAALIDALKTQPHVDVPEGQDPEKSMKYSNYGYGALGLILERASGQSYEAYVTEHIFQPLGLTDQDITVEYKPHNQARQVTAYSRMGLGGKQVGFRESAISTNALASAASICATPSAMARILSALLPDSGELLTPESKRNMVTPDGTQPQTYPDYVLGLQKLDNASLYGHAGGSPLEISYTFANPENGTVVSLAFNNISGPHRDLGDSLHNICTFFSKHPKKSERLQAYNLLEFCTSSRVYHTLARKTPEGNDVVYLPIGDAKNPLAYPRELHPNPDNAEAFTINIPPEAIKAGAAESGEKATFTKDGDGRITALTVAGVRYLPPDILDSILERMNTSSPPQHRDISPVRR